MRRLSASIDCDAEPLVHRVVKLAQVSAEWCPTLRFAILVETETEKQEVALLRAAGLSNIRWLVCDALLEGDVVVLQPNKNSVIVLYRESDRHHTLFLTNRCNSNCLMCSQPPTTQNDDWLVDEAIEQIRHFRTSPPVLGLSGGEPLLLGGNLRRILDFLSANHPATRIEVLTNGRRFGNPDVASMILEGLADNVSWLVPLYGHADFLHDFVVQSAGAYEETLAGLLTLQKYRQRIQLRIVMIRPVLEVLAELCAFIGRNLPFVGEVALMGCEPIGFALANREACEVDIADWQQELVTGSRILNRYDVPHIVMNVPLCALPRSLWKNAHKSISDWKNLYAAECEECSVKNECTGLFAWYERGWKPTTIFPILEIVT
jgi:His-Xaa-Ser system radical SAM maturase HxsC